MRAAWRLTNKATCESVYRNTRRLTIRRRSGHAWSAPADEPFLIGLGILCKHHHHQYCLDLSPALLAKCQGLNKLWCFQYYKLEMITGLPRGLEILNLGYTSVKDLSPLSGCPNIKAFRFRYHGFTKLRMPINSDDIDYSPLSVCSG